MNSLVVDDLTVKEINRLHLSITDSLKRSVEMAINIGGLLNQVKNSVGHGNFIEWIKENCKFSERTARNYMKVFQYKDKTARVADLTEAYKQIELVESEEKTVTPKKESSVSVESKEETEVSDSAVEEMSNEPSDVDHFMEETISVVDNYSDLREQVNGSIKDDDPVILNLYEYIISKENDSEKLDTAQNAIKICNIIISYFQKQSVGVE